MVPENPENAPGRVQAQWHGHCWSLFARNAGRNSRVGMTVMSGPPWVVVRTNRMTSSMSNATRQLQQHEPPPTVAASWSRAPDVYPGLRKFWTLDQSVNSLRCQFTHLSNGVMTVPCLILCAGIIIITYVLMWVPQRQCDYPHSADKAEDPTSPAHAGGSDSVPLMCPVSLFRG